VFGLIVSFTLRAEAVAGFDELTEATVAEIRRLEPGTLLYIVHRVDGDPHRRVFYELYQDADAFVTHETTPPHVRRFLEQRQLLVETVDVARIEPTISHGLLPHRNG